MLTSCHHSAEVHTTKKAGNGNNIYKPVTVKEYNSHMGSVDHVDQQLHSFDILQKSYKWHKKLDL